MKEGEKEERKERRKEEGKEGRKERKTRGKINDRKALSTQTFTPQAPGKTLNPKHLWDLTKTFEPF